MSPHTTTTEWGDRVRAPLRAAPAIAAAATIVLSAAAGCADWRGLNSLSLPGTQGDGPGSFAVQAQMPDVNNLQQNSRVRVGDVTVGNVTRIERQGWHALVTMRLDNGVVLPANTLVKLGQTSLLGSQHIELIPPTDARPEGRLHQGSLIPLAHSGSYPTTEQTLAALSMVREVHPDVVLMDIRMPVMDGIEFIKQVRTETAKVVWPTRRETVMTGVMVVIMTTILAVFFLGVDSFFNAVVKLLLSLAQ